MENIFKVLVIEDDQDQIDILLKDLPVNCDVTIAKWSREGYKCMAQEKWDYILTDLCLPQGAETEELEDAIRKETENMQAADQVFLKLEGHIEIVGEYVKFDMECIKQLDLSEELMYSLKFLNEYTIPSPESGANLFEKIIKMVAEGKIRGGGLCSNYEHHRDRGEEINRYANKVSAMEKFCGKSVDRPNALNLQIVIDRICNTAGLAWIINGEVKQATEKEEYKRLFFDGKAKMVKPYKEMIENLIRNC